MHNGVVRLQRFVSNPQTNCSVAEIHEKPVSKYFYLRRFIQNTRFNYSSHKDSYKSHMQIILFENICLNLKTKCSALTIHFTSKPLILSTNAKRYSYNIILFYQKRFSSHKTTILTNSFFRS
jgi:hypothetical protein